MFLGVVKGGKGVVFVFFFFGGRATYLFFVWVFFKGVKMVVGLVFFFLM